MDVSRGGRMNRPGSRLRRQRSQEWQDYSSSDNDEDLERQGYRYSEDHGHQYEDPRVVVDSRKHDGDRGKGRGNGNKANGSNSSGRSFSHSSVELLPARNFQGYREADNDMETENCYGQTQRDGNVILTGKQMQYPSYASLPRQSHNQQTREQEVNRDSQRNIANINNNSRGRLYLSLRRGPSSSSTSDNNSDATYTDSEPFARRRALDGQNVFGDSPPEPAPGTLPSRTTPPVYHIEALGRRPRLGYLESECESEPPYLPNMLSGGLSSFESQDISTLNPTQTVPDATAPSCTGEDGRTNINKLNKTDNERIYSQPQQVLIPKTEGATSATSTATTATPSAPPTSSPNTGGPTYSNPLPVFCSTPSSTTGPMVPVPNCVNPQLIQPATAPARVRQPFSPASAFSSTAISSSRFHFQKSCSHRCSWKMSTIVLIFVTTILTATMTYFAAMSSLSVYPESNKPCIVVSDRENTRSTTGPTELPTNIKGIGLPAQSACLVGLTDTAIYKKIILGTVLTKTLPAHESWNVWFSQLESTFVRFNFSVSHGTRLAFLARKNEPPSITAYDIMEVIADEHRLYKRATIQHDEVKFLHHLDPGTWYISIINDDSKAVIVNFHPTAARDIPTTCPNDCHEHGNCHLGKCHCFPGYIGPDCADSVCPVLCSGHGRYVHGRCRCEPGWKGAECSVQADECEIADCNGQGRCVDGTCQCNSGYRGLHCEEVDCLDPVCSGHGACIVGQCWCKIGWKGANCSEADGRLSRCFPDCSSHGVYDLETERCVCFEHWTGEDCSKAKCTLDCGQYGQCEEGRCHCEDGWTGERCDQRICDPRCLEHGQCNNGTCICIQGWMGRHCTLDGCPKGCNSHGHCIREGDTWTCHCAEGWGGRECNVPQEANCDDEVDDDEDGLTDCADSECCAREECQDSLMCLSSPDPLDILLRKQPPAVTASFYQKMKFLIEEQSVQSYAHRDEYSESRVAVVRGRVISREGNGLTGLRVSVATDPQFGFTLTRSDGWFDILVNGGGAITLQFQRNPFHPIKRTVMVPWNAIIVMSPVTMSATIEQEQQGEIGEEQEPCIDHDYDQMKPIVYQTWRPGSQGGCTTTSSVVVETQVLQESISIPGSDLHLIYQSSHAQGYLSTIHLQLTPSVIPETLRLVHLKVVVEGILLEKTFEADPDIKYTFAWNKRNIYKQKVYGLTVARVYVGYEYISCQKVVWTVRATSLRGFDMDISELGAWNLDVHHRYNFHEGVLQKGDGATIYFRQQPRVISVLMGNGQQRPLLCPECNGLARDNKLLAPVALTSGPDGSVYVGDYNLVRRITSNGQVYTVFRMRTSEVSNQYHLTLSPTDGHLYISDPERHKILRVHSLDKVEDPDSNFDVVVGSGERCLPRDKDNCGDGRPALEARLSYPKGMAVAVDNTLYFADGANIRMVDNRGIIHTLIGDHHHKRQWRPIPCSGTLKVEEVKLRWPTDLAINPLDGSLYFIDDHMVLKLTKDKRVMVVAGQPVYCKLNHNQTLKTRMIGEAALGSLISFTFGPTGELYIAEVDKNNVHRIRKMTPEGELLHFAGKEGGCECEKQNCTCAADEEGALAKDTKLYSISSLTVTSDGVVHLADQGSLRILSAIPYLPQPDDQLEFQIAYPENHEIYVFNKYGQHTSTKSILTGKTIYTFLYNVNTSFGKLSAVTDASGNKVSFLRDSGNSLHTIETARGQKCRVQVTKQGLLETIVDPDNLETKFEYDSLGLLVSRSDATGRSFFYLFDENGRVTDIVRASGRVTSLTFDLSPVGASVLSVDQEQGSQLMVTVKGTSVITREGGIPIEAKLHQDGAIEIETPWQQGVVWEPASHFVLQEMLPVQAGMFPLPVKQTTFLGVEPTNVVEWNYDLKYSKRDKDKEDRGISAVERVLSVNDFQFLTVEYDWVASREIFYNSSRRPFLVVQYDSSSRPIQWLPTDTRLPLNVMYDRLGRLSGWQQGPLAETFGYDRMGHLSEIKYPDNAAMRYSYDGKTMPSKVVLPSGRRYTFHYDDNGGLKYITTPKGTRHSFLSLISIGFYKLFYIPPGNSGPYVVHFNDHRLPTMKIFPGDQGRILYRYSNQSYVSAIIYGGGKVERNYTSSGFVASEFCSGNDVTVKTDYAYDGALLTSWKQEYFSPFHMTSAAFHYQYDRMFRVKMFTPRIGTLQLQSIEFRHNPKTGRIEQIGDFKLFDRTQNETVLSDGKASISKQVDALHRLRQTSLVIGDKEVFRMEIQYDSRNSVTQSKMYTSHAPTKSTVQNFSYDEDGQLIEMVGGDHWKFTYDENGNLVTMQYMGNRIDILHDIGDRIVSFGDTPYVVDGKGFVIQRGEEGFSYNTRGELVRASRNGKYEVLYYYDAKGRLSVRKDHFGNVTQFFYAIPDRPQLVTHVYNNADGRILSIVYDDTDAPIYLTVNKDSYYVASDHNGSPLFIFDKAGEVVKEIQRGPYGHVLFDSRSSFYLPVDFQKGIFDPLTTMVHFGDKIYDSLVGQWLTPRWDDVLYKVMDPRNLHLYRFSRNDPVNVDRKLHNKLDLSEWISSQGIEMGVLDLAASSIFGENNPKKPPPLFIDMPSVPLVSGFACAVQQKLKNFATISSVERPKVKREQLFETVLPKLSTQSVPFGAGITVSRLGNRAIVRSSNEAEIIRRDVFTSVFNNSYILDLHLVMHGQDVFYFVKDSTWRVNDDLNQLQRLGTAINTTVHESKVEDQRSGHQHVDIRVHADHSILNIRYGSTLQKERQRLLRHAKKHAVGQRWAQEREMILTNQRGSREWTEKEKEHILSSSSVPGYRSDYYHSVELYPELADDPANVLFHKSSQKHRR
ncbi:teneurin-m-like isoform X2 [Centruroides sculpturatus]|uniref:teneurin-m-like isoform X2 n=1 Tax=Centruroides sculpturatus TaxID=218467 RepID=UPI000C6D9530|nr:teneurin-m-like isoform X2 [Centruroides sculpturatus]